MNWLTIRWFKECEVLTIVNNNHDRNIPSLVMDGSLVRSPLNLFSQFFENFLFNFSNIEDVGPEFG